MLFSTIGSQEMTKWIGLRWGARHGCLRHTGCLCGTDIFVLRFVDLLRLVTMASSNHNSSNNTAAIKFALLSFALPYFGGYLISTLHLDTVESILGTQFRNFHDAYRYGSATTHQPNHRVLSDLESEDLKQKATECYQRVFQKQIEPLLTQRFGDRSPTLVLHRNGQSASCGATTRSFVDSFQQTIYEHMLQENGSCPKATKYAFESLLTRYFAQEISSACNSQESHRSKTAVASMGFYGYCDMGADHTPILRDHHLLVPVASSLPCHFHDAQGVRITSLQRLLLEAPCDSNEDCRDIHLYAVPAGRVFMHTASFVGQRYVCVVMVPGKCKRQESSHPVPTLPCIIAELICHMFQGEIQTSRCIWKFFRSNQPSLTCTISFPRYDDCRWVLILDPVSCHPLIVLTVTGGVGGID